MAVVVPDHPVLNRMSENEVRLNLACALYADGKISRLVAKDVAGTSLQDFDQELYRRKIPVFTEEMLEQDMESLKQLFPE